MKNCLGFFTVLLVCCYAFITFSSGCAQIGTPTGGPRDTLPPVLVKASPDLKTLNFKGNKISLNFDEYINVQDLQTNLLISPVQKNNPVVTFNLKNVTLKFKDSLLPNTTYSINFGDAIRDNNESNIFKNFTYLFSTGNTIDSLSFNGKVLLAETGLVDTTIIAMLYRNADDSAVIKRKPNYITKVNSDGSFSFQNLPADEFKVYALKDGDGGKTYNSKSEIFAFTDTIITVSQNTPAITLYASAIEKVIIKPSGGGTKKPALEKRLRYTNSLELGRQSLLQPLQLNFNNSLKVFDAQKILLTDTNFVPFTNAKITLDSTAKVLQVTIPWQPDANYLLLLPKEAVLDSAGNSLTKNDTLKFKVKTTEDYGSVVIRFKNLDISKHPILQFVENENIKFSYPITAPEWTNKLFPPGQYELRILYDSNQNGIWDPGNYSKKLQPEKAITLPEKISIRANWDNERDIQL
ncbi:MAG: Ig-like domain-containing protein [Ferruginibacter sp.]